jgi:uncharacterized protein (TIGR00730 family)
MHWRSKLKIGKKMLAFKNKNLAFGKHGLPASIESEFLSSKATMENSEIDKVIMIFGSARTKPKNEYCQAASELAFKLGEWSKEQPEKYAIATGGGPGIMEAGNKGAKKAKAPSLGFCIKLPFEKGANQYVDKNLKIMFRHFFLRKFWYWAKSSAIIVFPGGFGTLDELFEALTMFQLKKMRNAPLVLFGTKYWKKLVNWQMLIDEGMIKKKDMKLAHFSDSVEETFEYVRDKLAYLAHKKTKQGRNQHVKLH